MTQKEKEDFSIDLLTFINILRDADNQYDAPDVANAAVQMVRGMIKRNKALRLEMEIMDFDAVYDFVEP